MNEIIGNLKCENENNKIAIIVSRFNDSITQKLLEGSIDCLNRHGFKQDNYTIVRIPGAFEFPLALKEVAMTNNFQGAICLGAVIRGETPHFDYVCAEATKGIGMISLEYNLPTGFGLLTTDTFEQAQDRAGGKAGNKGVEATLATIEMINLAENLKALK